MFARLLRGPDRKRGWGAGASDAGKKKPRLCHLGNKIQVEDDDTVVFRCPLLAGRLLES